VSSEALYERYKAALQRGHVASVQGRIVDALTAYAEAAQIAPERATPHTSAGNALMRNGRPGEALAQFEVAIRIAPGDVAALRGRARALLTMDRPRDAAETYDALADACASAGQLADAVDAARRGLELAEGRERRRTLQALVEQLRAAEPDDPGREALERALRVLDEGRPTAASGSFDDAASGMTSTGVWPAPLVPEPEVPPRRAILDRELPPESDPASLALAAEAAANGDDLEDAVERLLDLAAAYRRAGSADAALDACYAGLSIMPGHAVLHLALVELYEERGWQPLAAEKLALLDRLAALDDDQAVIEEVAQVRAARA
jgi:tetratricopeptide (TPR) repeat protein